MCAVVFEEAGEPMEVQGIDPGRIVSKTVPLEDVPEVIASMDDFDTVGCRSATSSERERRGPPRRPHRF